MADKYPSAINKQLQAAARIGEIDIKIQRPGNFIYLNKTISIQYKFIILKQRLI